MSAEFHGDEAKRRWRERLARQLLRAAVEVEVLEKQALSAGNPAPHDHPAPRGEHPRLRTGFGRAGVKFLPATLEELARTLTVQLGYAKPAFYLAVLGRAGWKWVADTIAVRRARLAGIFAGSGAEVRVREQ